MKHKAKKNIDMEIFYLLVKERLTIKEIGEKLNMPADVVYHRLKMKRITDIPPIGYDYNEDGTLRINEEEAKMIRNGLDDLLKANKE